MTRMTMTCSGDLRCTARHEKSGETLATDAPTDNHGLGATFSPTDLVATALETLDLRYPTVEGEDQARFATLKQQLEAEQPLSEV